MKKKNRIEKMLELPQEVYSNIPKLIITGFEEIILENYKGILEYEIENYKDAIYYLENALKIKSHTKTYINEKFSWDETPYDVLSICYFNIKNYTKSLENINKALMLNPKNERIINNKKIVKNVIQ